MPEFAHPEEYALNGGFPTLERNIRIQNAGILNSVLDWFADIVAHGTPGTFSFAGKPNYNPVQNIDVPAGGSTNSFFSRTVDAGGAAPFTEPTPDVTVSFTSNVVSSRVTAGRSILGTTALAADADVPPGALSSVGTPGFLPFFVTLQRGVPGVFSADLTISYTPTELAIAGITPGSPQEAALVIGHFHTGTCMVGGAVCTENGSCGANGPCVGAGYTPLPSTVDTTLHTVSTSGVTSFSTFAVVHPDALAGTFRLPLVPGGGKVATDCRAEWQVANATNTPFLDKHGFPNRIQACTDGDPTCDADRTADGTCTFRVSVCLDQTDPNLLVCTSSGTTGYQVRKPVPTSKDPDRRCERDGTGERPDGARRHGDGDEAQRRPLHDAAGRSDLHRLRLDRGATQEGEADQQDPAWLRRAREVSGQRPPEAPLPARELIASGFEGLRRRTRPPEAAPRTCLSSAQVRRRASLTNPLTGTDLPE